MSPPPRRAPLSLGQASAAGAFAAPAHRASCRARCGDELLGLLARLVVGPLAVRRLHQVAGRPVELAGDAVVERQLDDPHRVDHDAGRVRRVPDLELQLDVERHVAEDLPSSRMCAHLRSVSQAT